MKKITKGSIIMLMFALILALVGCAVMEGGTPPVDTPPIVEEYPTEEQETAMPQLTDVTLNYDPDTPTVVTVTFVFEGEDVEGLQATAVTTNLMRGPGRDELFREYVNVTDRGEGMFEVTVELFEENLEHIDFEFGLNVGITLENERGASTEGGVGIYLVDENETPEISWISCSRRGIWGLG